MVVIRAERTVKMNGNEQGPSLKELRDFVNKATDWPDDSKVQIDFSPGNQFDSSSWTLTLVDSL